MKRRRVFTNEELPEFDHTPEELERIERLKIAWSKMRNPYEEEEFDDEED